MKLRARFITAIIVMALYGTMSGASVEKAAAAGENKGIMPAPADRIGTLRLDPVRVGSLPALVRQAALVVRAHPSRGAANRYTTGRTAPGGANIVHYVQRLNVLETMKGQAPAELKLVLPGVEPLPPAKDPLNEIYPGQLAADEAYVLFLQPTGLSGLYTTVGGWQGIYPIGDDGRTVALAGSGFAQLGGLTPAELRARLRSVSAHH